MRKLRATVRRLRKRLLYHRKKGHRAPRLRKAYNRAKAAYALALRKERSAPRRRAIRWARKQIGTVERPPFSNRGPMIDAWQRRFNMLGQPWCGAFVGEALLHGGKRDVPDGIVYTPNIYHWSLRHEHGLRAVGRPYPGDLVLFKFPGVSSAVCDHVGLYLGRGLTVEGNTSPNGGGSQNNGGGVYVRRRPRDHVARYVRVDYSK